MNFSRSLIVSLSAILLGTALTTPSFAAEKLTVVLDWFVNPDHAPLVIAKEKGFFKDAGLDVELIAPADPNDPPKLVAAGKADIAVSYQPQTHLFAAEGLPLVRFATLVDSPLNCLIVLKDGPVKTLADLKGRKIGYSVGGFEDAVLGAMLESVGLSLKDVELVNVNFSLSPSLYAGQVDAVIGPFRNFELNQMELAGKPGRAFFPEDHGVPAYDELVLLANNKSVQNKALPRFVEAVKKATAELKAHPDESWKAFITAYPDLNDDLNRLAWKDTLPKFANDPAKLDVERYRRLGEFLKARGVTKTAPAVESYTAVLK